MKGVVSGITECNMSCIEPVRKCLLGTALGPALLDHSVFKFSGIFFSTVSDPKHV